MIVYIWVNTKGDDFSEETDLVYLLVVDEDVSVFHLSSRNIYGYHFRASTDQMMCSTKTPERVGR